MAEGFAKGKVSQPADGGMQRLCGRLRSWNLPFWGEAMARKNIAAPVGAASGVVLA
jgi:hypothetical protein